MQRFFVAHVSERDDDELWRELTLDQIRNMIAYIETQQRRNLSDYLVRWEFGQFSDTEPLDEFAQRVIEPTYL